ncbi:MAG TPA: hypothetical protein VMH81_18330 [Bryobacteraceae bacterium]|nr:hypothetical protein [Bryobacteraceae bacterium]
MAQDPENQEGTRDEGSVDPSHELDLVTLYSSQGVDAEMEADVIRGIMDSNEIPSLVVRAMGYPPLGFEVRVPRSRLEEARRLVAEAEAAGPDAAAEAEAATEEGS